MDFDKEQYRARRNAGVRGQTNLVSKRGLIYLDEHGRIPDAEVGNKPVSKKALRKNTKRARKAVQ